MIVDFSNAVLTVYWMAADNGPVEFFITDIIGNEEPGSTIESSQNTLVLSLDMNGVKDLAASLNRFLETMTAKEEQK